MPKSTSTCNSLLALLLNATAWANVADNAASSPLTNTYVALYTASPGLGNNPTTNETAYTNYARVAVARTTSGWTAPSSGASSNVASVDFPECGVTGATITHGAIVTSASGGGNVWYQGALNASIGVSNLIQPRFAASAITVTET
jgi:hypothetical protein